jgi:hypothetical protein
VFLQLHLFLCNLVLLVSIVRFAFILKKKNKEKKLLQCRAEFLMPQLTFENDHLLFFAFDSKVSQLLAVIFHNRILLECST